MGGSPYLSCKRVQIKMRDYMDRRVTSPKRVTSLSSGAPPSCKRVLKVAESIYTRLGYVFESRFSAMIFGIINKDYCNFMKILFIFL